MNSQWLQYLTGASIGLLLLTGFPTIAVAAKLNADEVKQLVSGNTLVFRVVEGYEGGRQESRYYDANGTFRQFKKKANKTVKGTWSINEKGELCNSTKKRGACHVIYKQGNVWETYVETRNPMVPDKHILTIETVLEGNPNGL